jgi:hypothetical protein
MKKSFVLVACALLLATSLEATAKPERVVRNDKALLKPTRPPGRSLYLDFDPAIVLAIGKSRQRFELSAEQLRQLQNLVAKFQEALPKEREVAQQARDELEKLMAAEKTDEQAIQRAADRAIVAESVLLRGRMQFWLELRQRFGGDVFEKIQQTCYRHLNRSAEPAAKSANDDIFPAKPPELPAKD